jgi:hypothetical protein
MRLGEQLPDFPSDPSKMPADATAAEKANSVQCHSAERIPDEKLFWAADHDTFLSAQRLV